MILSDVNRGTTMLYTLLCQVKSFSHPHNAFAVKVLMGPNLWTLSEMDLWKTNPNREKIPTETAV